MSSWLRRVAMANWVSLGDLLVALREADESLPALQGADYSLPDRWRSRFAALTRLSAERVLSLELGLRFPHIDPRWFSYQSTGGRPATDRPLTLSLPLCADCCRLGDVPPLSRADCSFAFRTHCPRHLAPLVDHCGSCGHVGLPSGCFRCEHCQEPLRPTHYIPSSGGTAIIARLQDDILDSLLQGRPPSRLWIGRISASAFVNLIAELIDLVLLRGNHAGERQARYALVDLLTPGDFERRYNLGGRRFDRLHFPALPWFARFKVMAALTQLLLGDQGRDFFRVPVDVADRLRVFFLSVSWERRLGILETAESWPEPLRTQFAQAAARVAPPVWHPRSPGISYNKTRSSRTHSSI